MSETRRWLRAISAPRRRPPAGPVGLDPSPYDRSFYAGQNEIGEDPAARVLPLIVDLVQPSSVIDVGCGTGSWLRALTRIRACEVTGVDNQSVPRDLLVIPPDRFVTRDLRFPLRIGETFDLALCLEVAEHLPAGRSQSFVEELAGLAPAVLFSAAVPGQGGVDHINEQWPSYWVAAFERCGFDTWDVVRTSLWDDDGIVYYYRQNAFLFVDPVVLGSHPERRPQLVDAAHPDLVRSIQAASEPSVGRLVRSLPAAAVATARHRAASIRARLTSG